jgi:hypothetical protein
VAWSLQSLFFLLDHMASSSSSSSSTSATTTTTTAAAAAAAAGGSASPSLLRAVVDVVGNQKWLIYGAISGGISRTATAPLERLKVLNQVRFAFQFNSFFLSFHSFIISFIHITFIFGPEQTCP